MHTFDTPDPLSLSVRLGAGSVTVTASDTATSTVDLAAHGDEARTLVDRATVEQPGRDLLVDVPRARGHRGADLDVTVSVPTGSDVRVATDSADITLTGRLGTVVVSSGSGDVSVEAAAGAAEVTTGSGDVEVGTVDGPVSVRTGSGDLRVRRAAAEAELKSGSGDLTVDDAGGDVVLKSGSGDLTVGRVGASRVQATNASGSVRVGVADDLPAWLDLSTVTGRVTSDLDAAEPADGEPYAQVHAKTVSGDVVVARA
ncbi:DUF4097 family beta strand repeat-containing protein [Solicola sp. PLA-1-18]|uniref:DUF4097 family beta strand repeat-containing protein n=1 Tax=Solicola sp. PLA-1-18 TaxID=3380532 RepID=UPI003B7E1754